MCVRVYLQGKIQSGGAHQHTVRRFCISQLRARIYNSPLEEKLQQLIEINRLPRARAHASFAKQSTMPRDSTSSTRRARTLLLCIILFPMRNFASFTDANLI